MALVAWMMAKEVSRAKPERKLPRKPEKTKERKPKPIQQDGMREADKRATRLVFL